MDLTHSNLVDLTHTLEPTVPSWRGTCNFSIELKKDYNEGCRVQHLRMAGGIGTHMDAPSHFIKGGRSIADIPLEELVGPLCVLDLSKKCASNLVITPEDLHAYEKAQGKIPKRSFFFANTGWARFWSDPHKYRNPDEKGIMHFPVFSADAAEFLLERDVFGIGLDTLSPDGHDSAFPVHHLILGAQKHIFENVAHLEKVPPKGATLIALPLKIEEGSESPIRAIAIIN